MGLITKTAISLAQDIKTVDIDVPEWGGSVRLREMSAAGVTAFWESCRKDGELDRTVVQQNLLQLSLVDENNQLLFNTDDISVLMGKSAIVLMRLFDAAQELNGMGKTKEIAKNSEATSTAA